MRGTDADAAHGTPISHPVNPPCINPSDQPATYRATPRPSDKHARHQERTTVMASEDTANELPANTTVSFAGDVLAARIAPLVFAAMVALIGMLTITGAFSDFRDAT